MIKMDDPKYILNRYIRPPATDSTVFETLFFGSRYIQQGVYDIYLPGSIENIIGNGEELFSVLGLVADQMDRQR